MTAMGSIIKTNSIVSCWIGFTRLIFIRLLLCRRQRNWRDKSGHIYPVLLLAMKKEGGETSSCWLSVVCLGVIYRHSVSCYSCLLYAHYTLLQVHYVYSWKIVFSFQVNAISRMESSCNVMMQWLSLWCLFEKVNISKYRLMKTRAAWSLDILEPKVGEEEDEQKPEDQFRFLWHATPTLWVEGWIGLTGVFHHGNNLAHCHILHL